MPQVLPHSLPLPQACGSSRDAVYLLQDLWVMNFSISILLWFLLNSRSPSSTPRLYLTNDNLTKSQGKPCTKGMCQTVYSINSWVMRELMFREFKCHTASNQQSQKFFVLIQSLFCWTTLQLLIFKPSLISKKIKHHI